MQSPGSWKQLTCPCSCLCSAQGKPGEEPESLSQALQAGGKRALQWEALDIDVHFDPYRATVLPLIRITTSVPSDFQTNILCVCVCVVMPISFLRKERLLEQACK